MKNNASSAKTTLADGLIVYITVQTFYISEAIKPDFRDATLSPTSVSLNAASVLLFTTLFTFSFTVSAVFFHYCFDTMRLNLFLYLVPMETAVRRSVTQDVDNVACVGVRFVQTLR